MNHSKVQFAKEKISVNAALLSVYVSIHPHPHGLGEHYSTPFSEAA